MKSSEGMTRRRFLRLAAGMAGSAVLAAAGGSLLRAAGYDEAQRGSRCGWARLQFPGTRSAPDLPDWSYHPTGDIRLIQEIRRVTSIDISQEYNVPNIDDVETMCKYPFIFMHGQLPQKLSDAHNRNIGEYLKRGGFLFIDDCVLSDAQPDLFYQSMVREMQKALPAAKWEKLDRTHEVFHNVFELPGGVPHMQGVRRGMTAIYHKDRLVCLMTTGDLHCGWVGAHWFPDKDEQDALKMGVNIYVYAMTH